MDRNTIFANITNVNHDVILVSIQFRFLRSIRDVIFCPFNATSYRRALLLFLFLLFGQKENNNSLPVQVTVSPDRTSRLNFSTPVLFSLTLMKQSSRCCRRDSSQLADFSKTRKYFHTADLFLRGEECCFHVLLGWSRPPELGGRSSDFGAFMCVMSECGKNMDAREKLFCICV